MWEKTLIESKGYGRATKRWWTIPAAAVLHAGLIIFALFASYWHVEAVEAPPDKFTFLNTIPIQISPPPKSGGGPTNPDRIEKKEPIQETQPTEIAPLAKDSPIAVENFGPESSDGIDLNAPPGPGVPDGIDEGVGTRPFSTGIGPTSDEPPMIMRPDITPPVLLKRVEPLYPRSAIITRIQGTVVLEAVITKNGDVEQARTLRSDHMLFEKAATDAVLQWKYKPAFVGGRPVKVYFTVTVTFRLR